MEHGDCLLRYLKAANKSYISWKVRGVERSELCHKWRRRSATVKIVWQELLNLSHTTPWRGRLLGRSDRRSSGHGGSRQSLLCFQNGSTADHVIGKRRTQASACACRIALPPAETAKRAICPRHNHPSPGAEISDNSGTIMPSSGGRLW